MISLDAQIEKAGFTDLQKSVLKQLVNYVNRRDEYRESNIVFTEGSPVLYNADDGHYYSVTVAGTTPAVTLTDLGKKIP